MRRVVEAFCICRCILPGRRNKTERATPEHHAAHLQGAALKLPSEDPARPSVH